MASTTVHLPLTTARMTALAVMGAVYWFIAALVVRWTAPGWVGDDAMTALVFALIVPATVAALLLGLWVAGVGRAQAAIAATIMTGAAALLDGIALTWLPSLYGDDPSIVLGGAAAILWGAGLALVLGIVVERRYPTAGY